MKAWRDNPSSQIYKLFETLAALSVATPEGRVAHCATRYLLNNGWTQSEASFAATHLKQENYLQTARHMHGRNGGCANYIITASGLSFLATRRLMLGTIAWAGLQETTTRTPQKQKTNGGASMNVIGTSGRAPETERVSVPGLMTEQEKAAANFLLSRARDVSVNGGAEKRVVNPAEMLMDEGFVHNLPAALSIVSALQQHGVLSKAAQDLRDGEELHIYAVKDAKVQSAQTLSLPEIEKNLRKRSRETEAKMRKLREKRAGLKAEYDKLAEEMRALDKEMVQASTEEDAVKAKLAKFNNFLRELAREMSL